MNCTELKLSDIFIDDNFFIKIKLPFEKILKTYVSKANSECDDDNETNQPDNETNQPDNEKLEWPLKQNIRDVYNSYR